MSWLSSLARILGASNPASAMLVQLHSEIESNKTNKRLRKIEDPISHLHPDVQEISQLIYGRLLEKNSTLLNFEEDFYKKYSRVLAILEANCLIHGNHALGENGRYRAGLRLVDYQYILYMCSLCEPNEKMAWLVETVDGCEPGKSLDGQALAQQLDLPVQVVNAVFESFEMSNFGLLSRSIGSSCYIAQA